MRSNVASPATHQVYLTNNSIQRVYSYFSTEMLTLRKLSRFWVLATLLSLTCQVGYILACWYLGYHLPYNLSAGINAPKYLLGNVDPTIFLLFQWAILILMFDAANRHERNRITEVLDSKPIGNLEVLLGRTLAGAGVIWFLVVVNVALMQTIGSFSFFGWSFAETLQWHSVFNLLVVDGPINLIFWTSFLAFLTVTLRARILVVLVGGFAMFGWYWLLIRSPHSMLTLLSPFSNDTLFVSELVPRFLSPDAMLVRISYLLIAVFFLAGTAILQNRLDGLKTQRFNLRMLPISLVFGIGAFVLGIWGLMKPFNQFDRWKTVHAEHEWVDDIDILRISGRVHIDPPKSLETQFVISLVRNSGSSTKPLVFTLNPGMKVQKVEIGGVPTDYSFLDGLLEIQNVDIEIGFPIELIIDALGKPKSHFAYLDGVVNYVTDRNVPVHAVKILGRDGTIFCSSYVALMPGGHWYPTSGPLNSEHGYLQQGRDFFSVDLSVSLQPKAWRLVASTSVTERSTIPNTFTLRSQHPVPEIGLFASRFKHATTEVGGIDFSMYLHAEHADNLVPIEGWNDTMQDTAESWIAEIQDSGFPLLHPTISFVEVPRSLRTVAGGWRMNAVDTLPSGLVLLKEHGYPRANRQLAVKRYLDSSDMELNETEKLLAPIMMLKTYFQSGIGTDSPWTSLNKHLWVHYTSPAGEFAPILDQIVNWLISSMHSRLNRQFSIYSSLQIADLTKLQFVAAGLGLEEASSSGEEMMRDWYAPSAVWFERQYLERTSIWNHLEKHGTSQLPSTHRTHQYVLEALLLKSQLIASSLINANDRERVYQWINDIRTSFLGRNFTYADFIKSAKLHEITLEPFLTDWITQNELPSFRVYDQSIQRIANDAHGEAQYETTFVLQNTQPVIGYIELVAPTEETLGRSPFPNYQVIHKLTVDRNAMQKVNFLTGHSIDNFILHPGLSLNRESLYFSVDDKNISHDPSRQPSSTIEKIESLSVSHRIIVDDLDEGFQVVQELPNLERTPRFGPVAWFSNRYGEFELDAGLPISGPHFRVPKFLNVWQRDNRGLLESPFGRTRQTYAYINTNGENLPQVGFTTKLTREGEWQLDYHQPWQSQYGFRNHRIPEDDAVALEIVQGETKFEVPLKLRSMPQGWNEIGIFELEQKDVSVKIVFNPNRSSRLVEIYADAVRWTPMDDL